MSRWRREKEMVLSTAVALIERDLVIGTSGNVSMRLAGEADDLLAITPSSLPYRALAPDDIQVMDFAGNKVDGCLTPSMETSLHVGIYHSHPEVSAVIHTHSTYASAVAVTGRDIPPILDDQVITLGGAIRCALYAPSGSRELAQAALDALGDRSAVILRNHGAICTGVSLDDALTSCEILEKTARIFLLCLNTSSIIELTEEAIAFDRAFYDRTRKASGRGKTG